jgi:hypothetical protein
MDATGAMFGGISRRPAESSMLLSRSDEAARGLEGSAKLLSLFSVVLSPANTSLSSGVLGFSELGWCLEPGRLSLFDLFPALLTEFCNLPQTKG